MVIKICLCVIAACALIRIVAFAWSKYKSNKAWSEYFKLLDEAFGENEDDEAD